MLDWFVVYQQSSVYVNQGATDFINGCNRTQKPSILYVMLQGQFVRQPYKYRAETAKFTPHWTIYWIWHDACIFEWWYETAFNIRGFSAAVGHCGGHPDGGYNAVLSPMRLPPLKPSGFLRESDRPRECAAGKARRWFAKFVPQ